MRRRLGRRDLSGDDRLHFEFALGRALEDAGDTAGSFSHYAEGNRQTADDSQILRLKPTRGRQEKSLAGRDRTDPTGRRTSRFRHSPAASPPAPESLRLLTYPRGFFDRSISDERIIHVIRELGLTEWLERLPNGLDTKLETGGRLRPRTPEIK